MDLGLVGRRGVEGVPCIPGKVSEKSNLALVVGGTQVGREARNIPCDLSIFFPGQPLLLL